MGYGHCLYTGSRDMSMRGSLGFVGNDAVSRVENDAAPFR